MLHVIKDLERLKISAKDGDIGFVHDFYFDDVQWTTRYMVADTGNWLTERKVLISPHAIDKPDFENNTIPVKLIKRQIEDGPDISNDEPVSRQYEKLLSKYYRWPAYWLTEPLSQNVLTKENIKREKLIEKRKRLKIGDPHLRSIREVRNYSVHAINGEAGQVDSFLIDDQNWNIKYLVIDTRKWLSWLPGGSNFIISPKWIKSINWDNSRITIEYDLDTLEASPKFEPGQVIDAEYENRIYECYRAFVQRKYEFTV